MDTGLFDVLHHAADSDFFAVGDGIDVHFYGVIQEAVQKYRRIEGNLDGFAHVAFEFASVVHDIHSAAAEHIARTNHQRIADFVSQTNGLFFGTSSSVGRLMKTEVLQQMLEAFTVFSRVDRVRRRTDDVHAVGLQSPSEFERGLTAVLNDNAFGFFNIDDFEHVFECHRFEIQSVAGVVVG